MTEVVNLYHLNKGWEQDSEYVYIGRAGKGQSGYFGNPIALSPGQSRSSTLPEYEKYLKNRLETDLIFKDKVKSLHNKKLVCFCRPKTGWGEQERCHGQVLVRYVEMLNQ